MTFAGIRHVTAPTYFSASPRKRIAAFAFDFFAALLVYLCTAAALEAQGIDMGSSRSFILCVAAYHLLFLLVRGGATFGKSLQHIAVIQNNGKGMRLWQAFARVAVRYVPLLLVSVPYPEWELVPALLGLMAKVSAGLLWLRELHMLQNSPSRRTLADLVARTLVVNLLPPHTHRAPAGPMYSSTDAEFGVAPRRPPDEA